MSTTGSDATARMGSREVQPTISDEVLNALETYKKKDTNKSEFVSAVSTTAPHITFPSYRSIQRRWKCSDHETKHV